MTRTLWSLVCATALCAAALLNPATATAAAMMVTAGQKVKTDSGWCTISFIDPYSPGVAYTASHCYHRGDSRAVLVGGVHVGNFIPQVSSTNPDLIAIRLNKRATTARRLPTGEPVLSGMQPHVGIEVCKYGAKTGQTCGTVTESTPSLLMVSMIAEHGDSGAPIYIRTGKDPSYGIYIVGTVHGQSTEMPGVLVATSMPMIDRFLSDTYGLVWDM